MTKNRKIFLASILIIAIAIPLFVRFDYFLYHTPIATVKEVHEKKTDTKTAFDGQKEYEEKYIEQTITAKIKNGKFKGETVTLKNRYAKSCVYDSKYRKGNDVFIESIKETQQGRTAVISGSKRDFSIALALTIMVLLFIIIGGREGFLTIFSLAANLVFFYWVIILYFKGYNILIMCIPMAIIFTAMLLVFMYGKNKKTLMAFISTLITLAITLFIAALIMHFSGNIDYDFLDYLIQPYDQRDADFIFLSQVLICSMGAIMDVVVTMIITFDEIAEYRGGILTKREIMDSAKAVGDEVVGTMISIMFFTNLAAGIPFAVLSMRNGVALATILRYNSFFEIARFLTGSIGTVLSIPVSALVAMIWYGKGTGSFEKGGF